MLVLDHVAFGSRDSAEAPEVLARLGFATALSHCEWQIGVRRESAAAVSVVFEREYVDLIEVPGPRWERHLARSPLYRHGFAPTGLVLSGLQPQRALVELGSAATSDEAPYPITRHLQGESPVAIDYELLPLHRRGLPLALVADAAPQALRRAEWLAHPNGALGVAAVHLRVPRLSDALAALRMPPLSLEPVRPGGSELALGSARLRLHEQPDDDYLASIAGLLPGTDRPALLALEIRVGSRQGAARVLGDRGIRFREGRSSLFVDPGEGFGTGLILTEGPRERGAGSRTSTGHRPSRP